MLIKPRNLENTNLFKKQVFNQQDHQEAYPLLRKNDFRFLDCIKYLQTPIQNLLKQWFSQHYLEI